MKTLELNKTKKTGERWVYPAFEIKSHIGTTTVYFHGAFYRGYTNFSIGIQSYGDENWIVPSGYQFYVEGFEHDLANPDFDGKKELNIVHPQIIQENKTNTFKATLKTPYGDIKFEGEIHSAHRKQYIRVIATEIPNSVQVSETTI